MEKKNNTTLQERASGASFSLGAALLGAAPDIPLGVQAQNIPSAAATQLHVLLLPPLRSQRELSFAPTPLRDVSLLAANFQRWAALQVDGLSAGRARCRRRGANGEKFHISVDRNKHFSLIRREDLTEFPVF